MPREYRMLSQLPVDLQAIRSAADQVDPGLRPRLLFGGWAIQLVDDQDIAVLTVEASRLLDDLGQAEQLIGARRVGAGAAGDGGGEAGDGRLWWTEASAPWGAYGESGARLARVIAESVDARFLAEEGQ